MTPSTTSNNSTYALPKTASQKADDAFLQSLSPEVIAEQERILQEIQKTKRREESTVGRRAGTVNLNRRELSILNAEFC